MKFLNSPLLNTYHWVLCTDRTILVFSFILLSAYIVRGKVMIILVNVCLFTRGDLISILPTTGLMSFQGTYPSSSHNTSTGPRSLPGGILAITRWCTPILEGMGNPSAGRGWGSFPSRTRQNEVLPSGTGQDGVPLPHLRQDRMGYPPPIWDRTA